MMERKMSKMEVKMEVMESVTLAMVAVFQWWEDAIVAILEGRV